MRLLYTTESHHMIALRDVCELGMNNEISVTDLYPAWKQRADDDNGHKAGSVQALGRERVTP